MTTLKDWRVVLIVMLCGALGVIANAYPGNRGSELKDMSGSQDVRSLDRRISSLEQRLYSIETSISRLERSAISQRPQVLSPDERNPEINLLRGEIQRLQLRLSEVECGLLKLDERTTTSLREARGGPGARPSDPCRLNPSAPLRLSTRL